VYCLQILVGVGVALFEGDFTGLCDSTLDATVAVSVTGAVLAAAALLLDRRSAVVPAHVVDFLIYLWFVAGGLVGAVATKGSLGVIVVGSGGAWALHRHHSALCCAAFPLLMFWAGASLNEATDNAAPCAAIGAPVLVYGAVEMAAAAVLRRQNVVSDIPLKGPGSVPSWANPEDLVPFMFSSALEVSGVFFVVAGGLGWLNCPSDGPGDLGVGGELGFCGLLAALGAYLVTRGFYQRDTAAGGEGAGRGGDDGSGGLSTPLSKKSDAAALSFRFRLVGLLFINAAVWSALPAAESVAAKSSIIVAGSVALLGSGCLSMYWKQSLDALFGDDGDGELNTNAVVSPGEGGL